MQGDDWAGIIVAFVALISAMLSGRAARSAAKLSSDANVTNAKTVAETEAYQRARKMDLETIARQDEEIKELQEEVRKLRADNRTLHTENDMFQRRISQLEAQVGGS